ncbi:MAG: hypothetical protein ACYS83_09930 [Planctomycetota bacterium]|jgi:hypothetical protein
MANLENVSSEEELLQLRNEGKISEDEYRDLLAAIKKPLPSDRKVSPEAEFRAWRKRVLICAVIISSILIPIGLVCNLPFLAGAGTISIVVAGIKLYMLNKYKK